MITGPETPRSATYPGRVSGGTASNLIFGAGILLFLALTVTGSIRRRAGKRFWPWPLAGLFLGYAVVLLAAVGP